ncbi:hypothetical protein ACTXT7_015313 [Hymenolepis weldensis]
MTRTRNTEDTGIASRWFLLSSVRPHTDKNVARLRELLISRPSIDSAGLSHVYRHPLKIPVCTCVGKIASIMEAKVSKLIKESIRIQPGVNAVAAPFTYSIFDPRNPCIWFLQPEDSFRLLCIAKQKTMCQHPFSALPTDVTAQVINIINNSCDTLK